MTYDVVPDSRIPEYDPAVGWLERFLAWIANDPRPRMVIMTQDGVIMCHPASVPAVRKFLTSQGHVARLVPNLRKINGALSK